jgi:IPT/TIG domain
MVKLLFRAIVAVMAIVPGLFALQAAVGPAASAAVDVPVVTSIGSNVGPPSGGTSVSIEGSGFTSVTAVDFGSTPAASYTVDSPTLIFATTPTGSVGSTVDITVTNSAGTSSISSADQYTYANQTVINEVSPDFGPVAGGTTVTLSGAGFTGATSVLFGSTPAASYTVDSDSSITATVPPGTNGIVDIRVTTPFYESPATALDQYTYVGVPPTVTSLFGDSGSVVGGTFVQITGSGFTGVTAVDFGSTPAASYTVESPTLINAIAPAGPAGTVDVTVTNLAGVSSTSAGDQYTYLASVPPCTTTIIGTNAKQLTVTSGMTCLLDATQKGQVTVEPGAALSVTNSTVNGTVTATSPSSVSYCGSTEHGALTVTGATGRVVLGDGGNCTADTIPSAVTVTGATAPVSVFGLKQNGTLTLENDTDEVTFEGSRINGLVYVENNAAPAPVEITVSGNTVTGSLYCTGNNPAPADNGIINTVSGTASDQCAAIAQR